MQHLKRHIYPLEQLEKHISRLNEIADLVAFHFGESRESIKSNSRHGNVVKARNFIIYFIHLYLRQKIDHEAMKHRVIGLYLGRDRLTIRHHQLNIHFLINNDKQYIKHFFTLNNQLLNNDFI